jgi:hypothetical protein
MENGGKEYRLVSELRSYKLYGPKDMGRQNQIISAFERKGSRIIRFKKPELSDVDEVLLLLFNPYPANVEYRVS